MFVARSRFVLMVAVAMLGGQLSSSALAESSSQGAPRVSLEGLRTVSKPVLFTYRPFAEQSYRLKVSDGKETTEGLLKINAEAISNRIVVNVNVRTNDSSLRMLLEPSGRIIDFVSNESSRDDKKKGLGTETMLRILVPEFVPTAIKSGEVINRLDIKTESVSVPMVGTFRGGREVNNMMYGLTTFQMFDPKTRKSAVDIGYTLFDPKTKFPVHTEYKIGDTFILFERL